MNDTTFAQLLVQECLCSSFDEALCIAQAIQGPNDDATDMARLDGGVERIQDYLGVSTIVATELWHKCQTVTVCSADEPQSDESSIASENETETDDDAWIGPGECQLCERDMKLTRHHLIPKSTWRRIEARLLIEATSQSSVRDSNEWYCHLVPLIRQSATLPTMHRDARSDEAVRTSVSSGRVRHVLKHQTIDICRPCHNHLHKTYTNMQLAMEFNTLERILDDPPLLNFAKWAHKQRTGRYST